MFRLLCTATAHWTALLCIVVGRTPSLPASCALLLYSCLLSKNGYT
jgi:hypothetical protein